MDIDSARLAQSAAANVPVLRERQAEKTDQADLVAEVVRNTASLLEFGHDASRAGRGVKALLLDVLA